MGINTVKDQFPPRPRAQDAFYKLPVENEVTLQLSEPDVNNRDPFKGDVIGSCIVELRPKFSDHIYPTVRDDNSRLVAIDNEYRSFLPIGAALVFKGRGYGRVFDSVEKEREIMCYLLQTAYDPSTYDKFVKDYWDGFMISCSNENPFVMEVGFEERDGKLFPISPADYVVFRMCLINRAVANNVNDVNKSTEILFYLHAEVQVRMDRLQSIKVKDKANRLRSEVVVDSRRIKLLLLALTQQYITDDENALIQLYDFVEAYPDRFIKAVEDPFLEDEALVNYLISTRVFKTVENSTALFYEDHSIGKNKKEAIQWLRDSLNSGTYAHLKSLLPISKDTRSYLVTDESQGVVTPVVTEEEEDQD